MTRSNNHKSDIFRT